MIQRPGFKSDILAILKTIKVFYKSLVEDKKKTVINMINNSKKTVLQLSKSM